MHGRPDVDEGDAGASSVGKPVPMAVSLPLEPPSSDDSPGCTVYKGSRYQVSKDEEGQQENYTHIRVSPPLAFSPQVYVPFLSGLIERKVLVRRAPDGARAGAFGRYAAFSVVCLRAGAERGLRGGRVRSGAMVICGRRHGPAGWRREAGEPVGAE